jgi:microcystin-dependent protein
MFGGNFAPLGWALCEGQLLPIAENDALFSLIGTTYGGDGETTFALPDLRGRIPIDQGSGAGLSPHTVGEMGGSEAVTLAASQLPVHNHAFSATSNAAVGTSNAFGSLLADTGATPIYGMTPDATMHPNTILPAGGSQPHSNMAPYLCVNFIIALQGIYPPLS